VVSNRKFSKRDLVQALIDSGLEQDDLVYLSCRLFGIGLIEGITDRETFLTQIYEAIRAVIGTNGTLVVPTFTQQVGGYGVDFHYETTPCQTGIFSEWVRNHPQSIRSLHPVFSVAAMGPRAEDVCHDVSPVAFGWDSAFDRMHQIGGKLVCLGFDYYTGHIVSTMHYVETRSGVPYYYNKLVLADSYRDGKKQI
jgi:aminoglycoside 3-N-acetyltransferase